MYFAVAFMCQRAILSNTWSLRLPGLKAQAYGRVSSRATTHHRHSEAAGWNLSSSLGVVITHLRPVGCSSVIARLSAPKKLPSHRPVTPDVPGPFCQHAAPQVESQRVLSRCKAYIVPTSYGPRRTTSSLSGHHTILDTESLLITCYMMLAVYRPQ